MKKINQQGQILIFVSLGFFLLGLFVGMVLDFGRGYLERARISRTVDAMALAAARALLGSSAPSFETAAVAAGCGAASMNGVAFSSCTRTSPLGPASNPLPSDPVGCTPGTGAVNVSLCFVSKNVTGVGTINFVQVSGRSSIPTTFLRLLSFVGAGDYSTLPVIASAESGPDRPVDLMLVLDRSGSMNQPDPSNVTKINALKCALIGSNCPGGVSTTGFLGQGFTDKDKIGMTSFSNRGCGNASTNPVSEFTGDVCVPDVALNLYNSSQQNSVTTAISRLTGTNLTNTMEGIRTAIPPMTAAFADTSRASRKAVLLVTDGQPTALRLSSIAACQVDPVKYPLTTGSGINNLVAPAWTINAGCWFQFSAPGLRRNQLNNTPSPSSTITTTNPALSPAQLLYQHMMSATRNSARDEAYQLRALGGGNLIVFVIGIGPSNASVSPDARLDANARCLLGSIANDPDVINDPSTNNFTGGCAGVYQTSTSSSDVDPHADLRQTTPGGTPFGVVSGQLNGNLYTVDLTDPAGVTPQLQNIFGQIAAILKLRLTI